MAKRQLPSPEVLRQLLSYEPETGKLFWKERGPEWFATGKQRPEVSSARWNGRFSGREAFTAVSNGYLCGRVFAQTLSAHSVAWAIVNGSWPTDTIDHVNRDRFDNRLVNLRQASAAENSQNRGVQNNSSSGVKGVFWHKGAKAWSASIMAKGRRYHLGLFRTPELAKEAYLEAAKKYHGEFSGAQ